MAFQIKTAPPKMGGDAVELDPMNNKLVAILCLAREANKSTKFGPRRMTQVAIVSQDSKEPLIGVMFQSYFQDLPLKEWYIGKLVKVAAGLNKQWILEAEGLDQAAVKKLAKHLEGVDLSGVGIIPTTTPAAK